MDIAFASNGLPGGEFATLLPSFIPYLVMVVFGGLCLSLYRRGKEKANGHGFSQVLSLAIIFLEVYGLHLFQKSLSLKRLKS